MQNFSRRRVEQNDIVRKIVGHQQLVMAAIRNDGHSRGISNGLVRRRFQTEREFLSRRERLKRNGNKPLRSDLPVGEAVDGDAVSGVALLGAARVRQ